MKNPPFIYHRPESLDEALSLLAAHGDDAKVLAGGQSLLPTMALRLGPPERLIDISRLTDLDKISVAPDNSVSISALVRHASAEHSADIAHYAPLIHQAMPNVGHRAIRTRGTVVGSIAHADPAAEMPAVVLATGATMVAQSSAGRREIPAESFFEGYLTTSLRSDELLTEVRFPEWTATSGGAVVELSRRHGAFAMVGLACHLQITGGSIESAALAFFGVSSTPIRISAVESQLIGQPPTTDVFAAAAAEVSATLSPTADLHGSANYRKHLAGVLTTSGLTIAAEDVGVPA